MLYIFGFFLSSSVSNMFLCEWVCDDEDTGGMRHVAMKQETQVCVLSFDTFIQSF